MCGSRQPAGLIAKSYAVWSYNETIGIESSPRVCEQIATEETCRADPFVIKRCAFSFWEVDLRALNKSVWKAKRNLMASSIHDARASFQRIQTCQSLANISAVNGSSWGLLLPLRCFHRFCAGRSTARGELVGLESIINRINIKKKECGFRLDCFSWGFNIQRSDCLICEKLENDGGLITNGYQQRFYRK